jgi:hypothetical protein
MMTTSLGLALYAEPNALVTQKHNRNPKLTARGENRIAVVYSLPVLLAAVFLASAFLAAISFVAVILSGLQAAKDPAWSGSATGIVTIRPISLTALTPITADVHSLPLFRYSSYLHA